MDKNEAVKIIRMILRDTYGFSPRLIEGAVGRLEALWERDGYIYAEPGKEAERVAEEMMARLRALMY